MIPRLYAIEPSLAQLLEVFDLAAPRRVLEKQPHHIGALLGALPHVVVVVLVHSEGMRVHLRVKLPAVLVIRMPSHIGEARQLVSAHYPVVLRGPHVLRPRVAVRHSKAMRRCSLRPRRRRLRPAAARHESAALRRYHRQPQPWARGAARAGLGWRTTFGTRPPLDHRARDLA